MKTHELKTWPRGFAGLWDGSKRHEVRPADRDFAIGDALHLREWVPETGEYTGRMVSCRVTYITRGGDFGLPPNLVVMSIANAVRSTRKTREDSVSEKPLGLLEGARRSMALGWAVLQVEKERAAAAELEARARALSAEAAKAKSAADAAWDAWGVVDKRRAVVAKAVGTAVFSPKTPVVLRSMSGGDKPWRPVLVVGEEGVESIALIGEPGEALFGAHETGEVVPGG